MKRSLGRRSRKGIRFVCILQVCAVFSVVVWFMIVVFALVQRNKIVRPLSSGRIENRKAEKRIVVVGAPKKEEATKKKEFRADDLSLGTVNCTKMLEGSDGFSGMRYWYHLNEIGAAEINYTSPYSYYFNKENSSSNQKYLSFEVDAGGFNNVRMSFETIAVFAHATGRTLVMPPKQRVYLLKQGHAKNPKAYHGLGAFLNLDALGKMVHLINTSDFFQQEADGLFADQDSNRLYQIAEKAHDTGDLEPRKKLRAILRTNKKALYPRWFPMSECLIFGGYGMNDWMNSTDPPWRRLSAQHFCTKKRRIRRIDKQLVSSPWIHFTTNASFGYRLFTHWYTFFQFSDGPTDVFYRRFIRDHLHYTQDVFCAAGLVVRRLASKLLINHTHSFFSAVHIRRGELQYIRVRISAQAWKDALSAWIHINEPLFVLSDETNRSWFQPLADSFQLFFLDDLLQDSTLDPNKLGMIEQLVAASPHTRTFTGTHFSTFSSYVARLRAYYGHKSSTFFYAAPPEKKFIMHDYQAGLHPSYPFYNREWPLAWADIDLAMPNKHRVDPRLISLPPKLHYDDLPFKQRGTTASAQHKKKTK